jgi:hypothetical protein
MSWTNAGFVVLALATALIFGLAMPMLVDIHLPGQWCDNQEVRATCYRNWLAALSGWAAFAAAILVGWLTWAGVQRQVRAQQAQTSIADKTYWQTERLRIERMVNQLRAAHRVATAIQTQFAARDPQSPFPFLASLQNLAKQGLLETTFEGDKTQILQDLVSTLEALKSIAQQQIEYKDSQRLSANESVMATKDSDISQLATAIRVQLSVYENELDKIGALILSRG